MKRRVHQLSNGMMDGDAVSSHILEIDARLRAWGFEATIYADYIAPEMADRVRPQADYLRAMRSREDLLIYHYSIYNPNIRLFHGTRGKRLLVYHNITPAEYFAGWEPALAVQCETGRRALAQLSSCDLAVADSSYNREELIAAGFDPKRTAIMPIMFPVRVFAELGPNAALLTKLRQPGRVNWLTVGRVAPGKAIEDVIRVFAVYHHAINRSSILHIVGSQYVTSYVAALRSLVTALDLADAVDWAGRVPDADLASYYQSADLYMTASHHEGFCVPLLESMYFGVPILARKAAAIPETLGAAGLLFTDLGYEEVAEAAHMLISDASLRDQVIIRQRERLAEVGPERGEAALRDALLRLDVLTSTQAGG